MEEGISKEEKEHLKELFIKKNYNSILKSSEEILFKYKKDLFLYNLIGMTLNEVGKKEEALEILLKATKLFPNSSDLFFNLGNIYLENQNQKKAIKSYEKAFGLNNNIKALYNLANIWNIENNIEKSKELYKKVIDFEPDNHQAHNNLGNLYKKIGKFKKSVKHLKKAIEINKFIEIYHINLAASYREIGKNKDAIQSCAEALKINKESEEAYYNMGICYQEIGEIDLSIEAYKKAKINDSKERYLYALYLKGRIDEYFKEFEIIKHSVKHSSLMQALSNHSYYAYNKDLDYKFCKLGLNYIHTVDTKKTYLKEGNLIDDIRLISKDLIENNKNQKLLKKGFQSGGNIFLENKEPIKKLKEIIMIELANYKNKFKKDDNLLFSDWPKDLSLTGWIVEMNSQGFLRSHIHEGAWISGSFYLNIPKINNNENEGAIVFHYDNEDFNKSITSKREKIINPKEGDLILFPSSLYHKTLPFISSEKRICIAFDIKKL